MDTVSKYLQIGR